jgi:hypothetical protein
VLAARVVALVAALTALGWAVRVAGRAPEDARHYACPMHPEVRAPAPGVCAICRMALVAPSAEVPVPDEVVGTPLTLTVAPEVRAPAWHEGDRVAALLYADEVSRLEPGQTAQLHLGRQTLVVRRDATPPRRWDDASFRTSWQVEPRAHQPRRLPATVRDGDSVGTLELAPQKRRVLVVPYAAVIASPAGPYVLVVAGKSLVPRAIVTGGTLFDYVTVLGGLAPDERIIIRDAIAFAHQRRLAEEAP